METMSMVMPVIASAIGTLLAVMIGMALSKLNGIEAHLEQLNGKVFAHLTSANNHEAGFAKVDQQILNLIQTIKAAHSRLDHVEEAVHGRGSGA